MGYLINDGETIEFKNSIKFQNQIKQSAVLQFLNLYKNYQNYTINHCLSKTIKSYKNIDFESETSKNLYPIIWGDEIEGHIVDLKVPNKHLKIGNSE